MRRAERRAASFLSAGVQAIAMRVRTRRWSALNGLRLRGSVHDCETVVSGESAMIPFLPTRRSFVLSAVPLLGGAAAALAASREIYTGLLSSTAVGGYDPVAYFK
jgi:hypothetical protein